MEFLKEVFGAEALTLEQLMEKLKGSDTVKLGNLAGGAYVDRGKFALLETERNDLKARLEESSKKLEGYDPDWKAKSEQAEQAAQAKIAEMEQDALIREAMGSYTFTSGYARDGVADKVKKAGLKAESGKLLGLDDLMKSIKTESPDAFKAAEEESGSAAGGKLPFGAAGTQTPGGAVKPAEAGNLRDAIGSALFPKKE